MAAEVAAATVVAATPAGAASTLLSQGRPATASSVENATPARAAVDGTRWSSAFSDPQWIRVPADQLAIRAKIGVGQTIPTTYGSPLYPYGAGLQGWS